MTGPRCLAPRSPCPRGARHRPAITQHQAIVSDCRNIGIVRDQDQRHASIASHLQQQVEHMTPIRAVQIAGRLIGEDQRRIVGQRPSDRNALLLASRQLRRIVMPAIVQADFVEQRLGPLGGVAAAGDLHRHLDVLDGGERRHQVEELEHEADLLAAQPGQCVFVEACDLGAANRDRAARRGIEAGNQSEQRRLAAARRTDDRQAAPLRDVEIEGMQDRQRLAAACDRLADAA